MRTKRRDFEERIIDGKRVRIKIRYQTQNAEAGLDGKTITLTEKIKKSLNKRELNSVILHERGHLTWINNFLTFLPIGIILGGILYLINKFLITSHLIFFTIVIFILSIFILWIIGTMILLLFMWAREIYADWYSTKRTKGDIFRKTLKRAYDYNKKVTTPSFKRFYNGVILHPPKPIRLWIIKYMEKLRDKT